MKITYFLTGSLNDVDNDFELSIQISTADTNQPKDFIFTVILEDITSDQKLSAEESASSLLLCLNKIQEFITQNNIHLHSKILTSTDRNEEVDQELEQFISANTNL